MCTAPNSRFFDLPYGGVCKRKGRCAGLVVPERSSRSEPNTVLTINIVPLFCSKLSLRRQ